MDIDSLFQDIRARLQELEASQRTTLHELDLVKKSMRRTHDATTALGGTFAGIEQILRDHEQRLQGLEQRPPAA